MSSPIATCGGGWSLSSFFSMKEILCCQFSVQAAENVFYNKGNNNDNRSKYCTMMIVFAIINEEIFQMRQDAR